MAQFFKQQPDGEWSPGDVELPVAQPRRIEATPGLKVLTVELDGRSQTIVFVPNDQAAAVNGSPVIGNLALLAHQDELELPSLRLAYSAHRQPEVTLYESSADAPSRRCPVCRKAVKQGDSVVVCPGCARVYHQQPSDGNSDEVACWTYSAECAFCGHPTDLSGQSCWSPQAEQDDE